MAKPDTQQVYVDERGQPVRFKGKLGVFVNIFDDIAVANSETDAKNNHGASNGDVWVDAADDHLLKYIHP